MKLNDFGIDSFMNNIRNWSEVILNTIHYIILIVAVCSAYWVFISLLDMSENKRKLRAKINEVSEKLKIEKGLKIWGSLGDSNKKTENVK